jgi:hypothetical protein
MPNLGSPNWTFTSKTLNLKFQSLIWYQVENLALMFKLRYISKTTQIKQFKNQNTHAQKNWQVHILDEYSWHVHLNRGYVVVTLCMT